ncbi:MAG TPA: single-stranded-DNA-specific exonuclease RecJ [Planctomycetota bacterium]
MGLELSAQYRWRLLPDEPVARDRLRSALGLGPIAAQALVNRRVEEPDSARGFLDPSLGSLPDPLDLPGCQAAVTVLCAALKARTPVLVHGDYDVDGTCGAVLLYRLLRLLDHPVSVFVPDRVRDGYSFGANSLAAIRARGARLVIAVDNGTTAVAPLAELAAEGIQVIVVDHHLPGAELPRCAALVNPWVDPEEGVFQHFCGTGVAWMLAWALLRELRGDGKLPESERRFLVDALGLTALATVADVMPLRGPNRALVTHGLRAIGNSGFPGLRALCEVARIRGVPTTEDLGFKLAPRLNAAGRLGKAERAFQILAASDPVEARALALELDGLNVERREIESRQIERLAGAVERAQDRGDRVLFLGEPEAHVGVLGIVSNRLMEATGLPALLWAECSPGIARGSARAPEGHDLMRILEPARELFSGFGGHARAAGFQFDPVHAEAIAGLLRGAAAESAAPAPPTLEVDMEVAPHELDSGAVRELERLAPYGEGCPRPLFLCTGARLLAPPRPLGDGSHASLELDRDGATVRTLAWRMADRLAGLQANDRVDVVFEAGFNQFRGRSSVEWTLRDLRSPAT